jgi:DNA mismatch repair protein MutH
VCFASQLDWQTQQSATSVTCPTDGARSQREIIARFNRLVLAHRLVCGDNSLEIEHTAGMPTGGEPRTEMFPAQPPHSEQALLARARAIAGLTLGQLAAVAQISVPSELTRAKGWVGGLLERALGAQAGSRAVPDFEALGIELKTLPVSRAGKPVESTFVCTIELAEIGDMEWSASRVHHKLARVLWVPVEGERSIPIAERRIGTSFLWSPSPEQEALLRFDWEELVGLMGRGDVDRITGSLGRALQVRPKAADSRSRRIGFDADGVPFAVLPRGFYLRATFTEEILREHLHVI